MCVFSWIDGGSFRESSHPLNLPGNKFWRFVAMFGISNLEEINCDLSDHVLAHPCNNTQVDYVIVHYFVMSYILIF